MKHLEVNKILLIPMAAMAETGGPAVRTVRIAWAFQKAGCAAQDGNFHTLEGCSFYQMSVPFPLGLPGVIASHTFPVAEKLGITARKTLHSFEEVCFLTGALDYRYLRKSVKEIVTAIQEFQPDAIYSEFNLSAVIAGIAVGLPVYASYSRPAMPGLRFVSTVCLRGEQDTEGAWTTGSNILIGAVFANQSTFYTKLSRTGTHG